MHYLLNVVVVQSEGQRNVDYR